MELKEARKKARYTQEQVAERLGMSRVTYGKLEANPDLITIEDAKKLSELFEVKAEDIFFGSRCS